MLRSRLTIILIVINVLSVAYFLLIASPIYVSNASVIVRSGESRGSNMSSLLSGATGEGSEFGGYVFEDFAKSWNQFERLRKPLDFARQFGKGDLVSGFGGLATLFQTNEIALWNYYKRSVDVDVETKSGIVTIAVKAFDPRFAHALAKRLLDDAVTQLTAMNRDRERQMLGFSRT